MPLYLQGVVLYFHCRDRNTALHAGTEANSEHTGWKVTDTEEFCGQLTVIGSCQFVNSDVFLEFCYTIGESWVKNKWGVWHCICNILWVQLFLNFYLLLVCAHVEVKRITLQSCFSPPACLVKLSAFTRGALLLVLASLLVLLMQRVCGTCCVRRCSWRPQEEVTCSNAVDDRSQFWVLWRAASAQRCWATSLASRQYYFKREKRD